MIYCMGTVVNYTLIIDNQITMKLIQYCTQLYILKIKN